MAKLATPRRASGEDLAEEVVLGASAADRGSHTIPNNRRLHTSSQRRGGVKATQI
jgi:hypothetical protein